MNDARGGRNARPAGPGRGRGRAKPATPGRGSRAGAGPATRRTTASPTSGARRPAQAANSSSGRPGSAARTPEANRRRRNGITGRAAILALVIAALVISYASSLRAWAEQRGRIADLRAEASQRSERVAELEKELGRWKDPAYVEAQARERFGWVMPGETGYVVVGGTGKSATPPVAGGSTGATEQGPAQRAWWSSLWGSVEEANKPPKPTSTPKRPKPAATIDPESTPSPGQNR
ncbi:septum formation initiator family protein [Actinopolymorpha pittospori]|uniref:Cell division protein FtsB n=1 Tax=Actinopolymorpha pittospori TaxID=648752 RepID=A0A927N3G8_9ACTN|nr:cell division protein FtsB [Actinopolymorpha pittospori]